MIPGIVVAVLACLALAYVVGPLRRGSRFEETEESERTIEAEARKRTALTAIVDIEGELEVGKLTQADFEVLRAQYETEALDALAELDALGKSPAPAGDDELEARIRSLKASLTCPACGAYRTTEGNCERCGV